MGSGAGYRWHGIALRKINKAVSGSHGLWCRTSLACYCPTTSSHTAVDTASLCDVVSDGPICFGDGSGRQQVLLPPAVTPGTVGLWTFDEERAMDSSGNNNHATTDVVAGPSPMSGNSAYFLNTFLMIPHSPSFPTADWSYTFWLYLMDNSEPPVSALCSVIRKGINDPASQQQFDAPSVLFDKATKKLRLSVTTNIERTLVTEHVDSNARLGNNRWFHIGVVHHHKAKTTRLYVNGVLDVTLGARGFAAPNEYPLYVGGDPYTKCDLPVLIDELQVLDRAMWPSELQAAAAFASGAEASFVRLACVNCPLAVAMRNCPVTYHMCTSLELHSGALQVARTLGWLGTHTHVWTHQATAPTFARYPQVPQATLRARTMQQQQPQQPGIGLGLCCADAT